MEWYFRAEEPGQALSARRAFVAFLRKSCTSESDYAGAEVVFGELVSNVILHATGPIEIVAQVAPGGAVTLAVCDTGPSFSIVPALPPVTRQGGRGLYIVSRLADDVVVERLESGNRVRVVLPVTAKPHGGSFSAASNRG